MVCPYEHVYACRWKFHSSSCISWVLASGMCLLIQALPSLVAHALLVTLNSTHISSCPHLPNICDCVIHAPPAPKHVRKLPHMLLPSPHAFMLTHTHSCAHGPVHPPSSSHHAHTHLPTHHCTLPPMSKHIACMLSDQKICVFS